MRPSISDLLCIDHYGQGPLQTPSYSEYVRYFSAGTAARFEVAILSKRVATRYGDHQYRGFPVPRKSTNFQIPRTAYSYDRLVPGISARRNQRRVQVKRYLAASDWAGSYSVRPFFTSGNAWIFFSVPAHLQLLAATRQTPDEYRAKWNRHRAINHGSRIRTRISAHMF